jgi:hypothetical protein
MFVLDDFEIIDTKHAPIAADELDGLQRAVTDVDSPGETGAGHAYSSWTVICAWRRNRLLIAPLWPRAVSVHQAVTQKLGSV